MTIVTVDEANQIRRRAIKRAVELDLVGKILHMLNNDASTVEETKRSRPLPGSGLILHKVTFVRADGRGERYQISVASADNHSDRVFWYEGNELGDDVEFMVFRDGPWVQLLIGAYEALKHETENIDAIRILKDFAPVEGPREP